MIFSTPEREFLRQAALVKPDWAYMQTAARTNMDYHLLWTTALLHQLQGVMAWRLTDERMEAYVPQPVIDHYQRYLKQLDRTNERWWSEATGFCGMLENSDIPYLVCGGPTQYAVLGIEHFPRRWTDLEVDVDIASEDEVTKIAELAGAEIKRWWHGWWDLRLPMGSVICLGSHHREEAVPNIGWNRFSKPPLRIAMLGAELNVPDPNLLMLIWGWSTWIAMCSQASRLSLWALARLAAWMTSPRFSLAELSTLLAGARPDVRDRVMWILRIAQRVYDISLPDLEAEEPSLESVGRVVSDREAEYTRHFLRWQWPGDEQMIFDHALSEGLEGRLAAGIWELESRPPEKWEIRST